MRNSMRSFATLMRFSFGAAPLEATAFLTLGALMSLTPAAAAYGTKLLVDAALNHDASRGLAASLLVAGAACLGLLVALYYIDTLFSVAEKTGAAIDRRLMDLVSRIPGIAHHEQPAYLEKMDLLRDDRPRLAWMTNATAGMVRVAVQLVASGILLARLNPILLLLPLAGLAALFTGRRRQVLMIAASEQNAERERLRRHLFETATSAASGKEIRVFSLGDVLLERHHEVSDAILRTQWRAEFRGALLDVGGGVISGLAYVGAIGLVLTQAVQGHATPGDVVLAIGLAAGMNSLVLTAVLYGTSFLRLLATADRYLWLERYARGSLPSSADPVSLPDRLHSGIDLEHVAFTYDGSHRQVLGDVSVHLAPGSVVALVGDNGAGKSTLVKLLCDFYKPTSGRVTVDGIDLQRVDPATWRARTASAFQDFARFELTAQETVGVGDIERVHDRAAVAGALDRAGADGVRAALPDDLDTQLGRAWDGVELSGGQWQKLALARAMMRDRPLLLVLDEPTASLDAEAEHALFERYAQAARWAGESVGTVTLLVTHRFSTVRMADTILVLDGGHIVEQGSHAQLMARAGLYAEMYELQARTYR